ncbi:OsmC family peroxiredoxin [Raineyella fluvialis]|uniref:OsmC family peroxiredoxin n=2 Tax=Raineyella fluvialis TaxID=2662261 RepID=A0A5Q2FD27_9ACTN|nr:OsmC family peroxiredoxin [Raineyella fluvialis]
MSTLREYLVQKKAALLARRSAAAEAGHPSMQISARVTAEGRSGVRRIRIRDHHIISDSPADFAGYDLGPSSPEIQLGVLGSCLTHIYLIKAAEFDIELDSLAVGLTARLDPRGGLPEFPDVPVELQDIHYEVQVASPAEDERLEFLKSEVERVCPVLNPLARPQSITGSVARVDTDRDADRVPVPA